MKGELIVRLTRGELDEIIKNHFKNSNNWDIKHIFYDIEGGELTSEIKSVVCKAELDILNLRSDGIPGDNIPPPPKPPEDRRLKEGHEPPRPRGHGRHYSAGGQN